MRQKKGFVLRDICGEKAIVGEGLETVNFGKLISLNDTAARLWEKAAELGDFTEEQLADAICEKYDVEKSEALSDITKIVANWKEIGLIE